MPRGRAQPTIDRLLTTEEVAAILRITKRACQERIKRGQLPVVKMGRSNRIKESDLNAYIASLPQRNGEGSTP